MRIPAGILYLFVLHTTRGLMRSAIFVDAGYLYAQGSVAIAGKKLNWARITLNLPQTVDRLRNASTVKTGHESLLRIYWYDGLYRGQLSPDQQALAYMDDVKLRLGTVNQTGQQKGVDSLIVTDLVELARNHAITDAVLLSGDEDLRIGVQIAQSFGVRVHLIGIEPSRGSQSHALLQEADTTSEWSANDLSHLITLSLGFGTSPQPSDNETERDINDDAETALEQAVVVFLASLEPYQIEAVADLENADKIPRNIDSKLLVFCRGAMDRDLDDNERDLMRNLARKIARERSRLR